MTSQSCLSVPQWQLSNKAFLRQGATLQQTEVMAKFREHVSSNSRSETESLLVSSNSTGSYSSYTPATDRAASTGGSTTATSLLPSSSSYQYLSPRVPPVSTYHHPHPYVNTHWIVGSEDTGSSSHSSNTSFTASSSSIIYSQPGVSTSSYCSSLPSHNQTLSYLTNLPPPPQYPGLSRNTASPSPAPEKGGDIRSCRSYEAMDKMDAPRSRPDLRLCASSPGICMHDVSCKSSQR